MINLNVENLYLNGINNVLDILPISRNAKEVSLKNCNVSEVSSFLEYPELKYLNLEGNNIGVDSINDLNKIIQNGIDLRFENTDAHKFLKSQKIEIEDADVERDIKSIFRCFSDEPLNEYDIFIDNSRNNSIIKNKKVLETLISKGLIDKIKSENIRIELDDFLGVDVEKILNFKNRIKHIEVKSFNGLTSEKLDKLSNINWCVDGDSLTPKYEDVYYNSQDMKDILEAMERIKASIPENAGDLEKFLTVYKNIGMYAHYDRSGNLSSEEYVEGNEKVTRSLKGALVKGKAVCRGYALALKYCVKFVDVEARDISGYAYGDPDKGHSWNQVKIEDKWYNTDLTWDYRYVGKEVELKNCLKSDVEFYKNHTVSSTEVAKVCNESYDSEIIVEKLKSIRGTDLDKSITDATEEIKEDIGVVNDTQSKLVTFQDFRKIAEENSINPSTLNDLTQINEGRIENKRRKEISANEH